MFSGLWPVLEALLPLEALPELPGVEVVEGSRARGGAGGRKPPGVGAGETVLEGAAEDDWDPGMEPD